MQSSISLLQSVDISNHIKFEEIHDYLYEILTLKEMGNKITQYNFIS